MSRANSEKPVRDASTVIGLREAGGELPRPSPAIQSTQKTHLGSPAAQRMFLDQSVWRDG